MKTGIYKKGLLEGAGGEYQQNGDSYVGSFKNGLREGWGMIKERGEEDFEISSWKQGKRHGMMLENRNGIEKMAEYIDNLRAKEF
jgi:hypothetical protein